MSSIQVRADNDNEPFVLNDDAEVRTGITIEASQGDLEKGAVLGEVTADPGVYALCDSVAVDGSQLPKLILAEAVADNVAQQAGKSAYEKGLFAASKLTFGGVTDLDSRVVLSTDDALDITIKDALRSVGLRVAQDLSLSGYENS